MKILKEFKSFTNIDNTEDFFNSNTFDNPTSDEMKQEALNLINYKKEMKHLYASSYGTGGIKKLYITGNGYFIVEHFHKEILKTKDPLAAVEKYFSL